MALAIISRASAKSKPLRDGAWKIEGLRNYHLACGAWKMECNVAKPKPHDTLR